MKYYKTTIICLMAFIISSKNIAQSSINKNLSEIIKLAQSQSIALKVSQTKKDISNYEYLSFKSNLKPQITINGNLPSYSKQYSPVVQPDGTITFLPVKQNLSNIGIGISQKLLFSGGDISVNTNLSRFDEFKTKYVQYNGTPIFIKLNQPLFSTNDIKWQRKIEPLKLDESIRLNIQEIEFIAQNVTSKYFNVIDAQNNSNMANVNVVATTNNYEIEKKRVILGKTSEDKLLQLELQMLNSKQAYEKAKYDYQIALLDLKSFLGNTDSADYNLILPEVIPEFNINVLDALKYANQNRAEFISFQRKKLERAKDVALAKAAKQQVILTASFGYNRAAEDLNSIYLYPQDQQTFSLGFNLPIIDWGRRKMALYTAKSLEKLTEYNNEIDKNNINQEIVTLVKNIALMRSNINLARITDSVGQRRFQISNRLFQEGKVSITDLNIAQNEKDLAKRNYINSLRSFWDAYYYLRRLTLFDFDNQKSLFGTLSKK
ncbi:MAG: TolC family protein [Bacteroidetes bacterium]|nr:TolC family protein [Bacteroidota bacterium]